MPRKVRAGFTIVELLIVIVVIAILAAISVVAYSGIQQRANDTRRTSDIAAIAKALDLYYTEEGSYPPSIIPSGSTGGWEISNNLAPGRAFMQTLNEYSGTVMPVDPTNSGSYFYQYISLNSGYTFSGGCRIDEPFYVLRVTYESASNNPTPPGTAAATCDGQTGWPSTDTRRYISPAQARQ